MKNYYRIMLGKGSIYADECFAGDFIGADFEITQDLTDKLPDDRRKFNKAFIPIHLAGHPGKTKIAAGLACGALWTVSRGILKEDLVLCPDGAGRYRIGEITGGYYYAPGEILPHRRPVHWLKQIIDRADMSDDLKHSTGSIGTVSDISDHHDEIERLMGGIATPTLISTDESVENPSAFALEKHLEDFLVENWTQTELGKKFDIYRDGDEVIGQQYPADNKDRIDILAISKDKKELVVVELKKGRASDLVVGQIQRYMGYVLEELAEESQTVRGIIIALEDDLRIRRALTVTRNIEFYRYEVSFKLVKG